MARLIAALFLYFLPICLTASKCYYPNGIEANDFPCDPDAEESVCCSGGLGTVCLSNKLCIGADGNTLRGSCTDKNWASPECAMFCLGTVFIDESTSTAPSAISKGSYSVTSATSTYATTASEASASSSASDMPASSDEPPGMSTGAKAGIGAGVGVGVVLAMTVVYLLWRMRKNKSEKQLPPTYYGPGIDTSWQQSHYALGAKEFQPQPPQELYGQALHGYNVRAELPAHN
ncbi:hypothetical protein FSPOR_7272 [Fusarium sporotrichioides]|uniref:Uncharacterized protein n=1 Tax=Fusarium sporotrichioides TaxID=5514 RepID=A0A395RZK6_FUSSP|nr:hypothetical protein FSPOR_7272 [Fusarium sporotrichioides]